MCSTHCVKLIGIIGNNNIIISIIYKHNILI